jgi:hypothetical protein
MQDYAGPERRIHKVYVTRNTEYHVRRNICIAVRDRRTGRWVEGHIALRKRLEGSLRFHPHGGLAPNIGDPAVGDAIYFRTGERDLITSRLESIERPSRDVVAQYTR